MTATEVEIAVARFFNWRRNVIVPNVSWGLGVHECDLLVLTAAGYCYEVEIKVTKYDLFRDADKSHAHESPKIKRLYFAFPEALLQYSDRVPKGAGILTVGAGGGVEREREADDRPGTIRIHEGERFQLCRLGTMRIWALKRQIVDFRSNLASSKKLLRDYERKTKKKESKKP